jgi:hypothetical protein
MADRLLSIIQRILIVVTELGLCGVDRFSKRNAQLSLPALTCIQNALFIHRYELRLGILVQSS